jgi:hypothetical protein
VGCGQWAVEVYRGQGHSAFGESGKMRKINDAGNGPVPEKERHSGAFWSSTGLR